MPWPDHIPTGQFFAARALQDQIILECQTRLQDPMLPGTNRILYDLILAHAQLDRHNHAHGKLRDLVKSNGNGETPNPTGKLDTAWANVKNCYDLLMAATPPDIDDLSLALKGIDHGGGGGFLP